MKKTAIAIAVALAGFATVILLPFEWILCLQRTHSPAHCYGGTHTNHLPFPAILPL